MIRRERKGDQVKITFALPDDELDGRVSVVGDFNEWTPGVHILAKRGNGTRSVAVSLPKNATHRFRYLGEGGRWFDDPDADARHDWDCVVYT
jgi:hypothetical protein